MTATQFAKLLNNLKPELRGKEVMVIAPNGLYLPATIKFVIKDPYNLSLTKKNVKYIVVTYEEG